MLKTFSIGGVHPHGNKLSAGQPIVKAAAHVLQYSLIPKAFGDVVQRDHRLSCLPKKEK